MDFPNKDFSIRGIARDLKISHATVIKHIADLKKTKLIKEKDETLYVTYYANAENDKFKFYKKNKIIFDITNTGLIEFIKKQALPSSIILFGSCTKGTYTEKSDIDIFVEADKKNLIISEFEKKINRDINILFEKKINNLSKELKNNILNGIILHGFIRM